MSVFVRRVIAAIFIGVFLIGGPLLLFYAAGYRFNTQTNVVVRTGTLVASSMPSDATIKLDGTSSQKTPATITSLLPREYDITLEKSGYHSWNKQLTIRANEAIFVSDIRLFRDIQPTLVHSGKYTPLSKSPSGSRYLLLIEEEEDSEAEQMKQQGLAKRRLAIFLPASGAMTTLATDVPNDASSAVIDWSVLEDGVTLVTPTTARFYSLSPARSINLTTLLGTKIISARFPETTGAPLLLASATRLYTYNILSGTYVALTGHTTPPSGTTITDALPRQGRIYELHHTQDAPSQMVVRDSNGANEKSYSLPNSRIFQAITSLGDTLFLLDDQKTLTTWQMSANSFLPLATLRNVLYLDIDRAHNDIIYTTGFELWTYNTQYNTRDLLTRLATPILSVRAYPLASHVFFTTTDGLFAIERDGRDVRNRWQLAVGDEASRMMIAGNGNILWFTNKKPTLGLYRREL